MIITPNDLEIPDIAQPLDLLHRLQIGVAAATDLLAFLKQSHEVAEVTATPQVEHLLRQRNNALYLVEFR